MSDNPPLDVLVLSGGPDRERPVSLISGEAVARALVEAGHRVTRADPSPADLSSLDGRRPADGGVVFPVLHGGWGEGGGLQRELERRQLAFVGSGATAAGLAMDKAQAKATVERQGVVTPPAQVLQPGERPAISLPLVLKPTCEGSSIGMWIVRTTDELDAACDAIARQPQVYLAERYVVGRELTVGVLQVRGGLPNEPQSPSPETALLPMPGALPVIEIAPQAGWYDYHAKYESDATTYHVGAAEIDLPASTLQLAQRRAVIAHLALGCRHLSRTDFLVDADGELWYLETNTMPGFTSHSLLPMAAHAAGLPMPALVDRLLRTAAISA